MTRESAGRLLRAHASPRQPRRPTLPPRYHYLVNRPLPRRPRAVLFDIYGTLFLSASGDVGSSIADANLQHFTAVARAIGHPDAGSLAFAEQLSTSYFAEIKSVHASARQSHRTEPRYVPEVDVRLIWKSVLERLAGFSVSNDTVLIAALSYEALANPVWPMPDSLSSIMRIRRSASLGLVSNAQFYTEILPEIYWGQSWASLRFDPRRTAFSYLEQRAKPDPAFFDRPLASLRVEGIDSEQVLYVGNDMLNDVWTAGVRGCMTALYAGDTSSLRLRTDRDLAPPDSIVLHLDDLATIISPGGFRQ